MPGCNKECWTPVKCPICGGDLPPRGRDAVLVMDCCVEFQYKDLNKRHLWDEHDSTRAYVDPVGWMEHLAKCKECEEK